MVFHLLQEEFLKSKYHLKLMKMVLWMYQPLIKEQVKMEKLPSPIIKEDFLNKKLKSSLKMLRNIKNKTKKLERKSKLKTVLKATVLMSNTQWMTKNSKEKSVKTTKRQYWVKYHKLKAGCQLIPIVKLLNMKANRNNLKVFTIQ